MPLYLFYFINQTIFCRFQSHKMNGVNHILLRYFFNITLFDTDVLQITNIYPGFHFSCTGNQERKNNK